MCFNVLHLLIFTCFTRSLFSFLFIGEFFYNENDDYIIVRLFGNYEISDDLIFNARIENLFDEKYEEVIGYPALGRAVHAGLTYNF